MARGKKPADRIGLRGGIWYYVRRVPVSVAKLDSRKIVKTSLQTDDKTAACLLAETVERDLEAYWVALAGHSSSDARVRYEAALARAQIEGFLYKPARELVDSGSDEIGRRMLALKDREEQTGAVEALLGGVEEPQVLLSEVVDLFQEYSKADLLGKRPDQIKNWRQARERAINNLILVVKEDKPITRLTRDDARAFRDWWVARIVKEKLGRNVVNKQLGQIARMLFVISEEMKLDLEPHFAGLMLKERQNRRPPFGRKWVEQQLLRPGALDGLNDEARCIFFLAMEAGVGLEESTGLLPVDIKLDHKVPHIEIVARDGSEQKTDYRPRVIPLVGVALLAMRAFPQGFPRYQGKTNSLSAVLNSFLRENDLLPSKRHSFYSIRHDFQDRMTEAEALDRLQADLMGHKFHRERYGLGASLEQKQRLLEKIAYKLPPGFSVINTGSAAKTRALRCARP